MDFKQIKRVSSEIDFHVLKGLHGLLTSRYRRRERGATPILESKPASDLGVRLGPDRRKST